MFVRKIARIVIPSKIRKKILNYHQNWVFKKAIKELRNTLEVGPVSETLIEQLIYGWGNQGYSAMNGLVREIIEQGKNNQGSALECGTGLSTILLGIIADKKGTKVVCLEDHPEWASFIRNRLLQSGVKSVEIYETPLVEYNQFKWYKVPPQCYEHQFSLVVCDGPSDKSQWGRYGLLPVLKANLTPDCTILFDDYNVEPYLSSADRWCREYDFTKTIVQEQDVFIIFKLKNGHT